MSALAAAGCKDCITLSRTDLAMFARIGVNRELLAKAKIQRVTDAEAREILGLNGQRGDMGGIYFPYLSPRTGFRVGARVRRDNPEMEDGRPKRKYMAGFGDRRHLFCVPGTCELVDNLEVPIVLVEAEKSALALTAWSERTAKRILPLALGGCYGWRGRIGKVENHRGERVDELGPLPDLNVCAGRRTYILLDSNAGTNPEVRRARRELAKALRKIKADARVLDLPQYPDVNGPDDFIAIKGDDALLELFSTGLLTDKNGQIRGLLSNAATLLRESPEWSGVLAYNEFSLYFTTKKPAPWQGQAGANWTDYDNSRTTEWLQHHDVVVNTAVTAEAVATVAKENPFHPVRDYLKSLSWDQSPRIETWLTDYLGAENSSFLRAVGPRWLISAVARIFKPGCQVDHTLLLEGTQGIRKSTALQTLAGDDWFTDHLSDLGGKDSRIELHGKWIIEFSELASVRRGDLERVKAFLTARIDNFRTPYARCCEAVPRACVFAASVNDATPFTDPTGSRRFWPVRCGRIDVEKLEADRNQLWGEAYTRYCAGEVWWLDTEELNRAATLEQDERYEPGVWDEVILDWTQKPTQRFDRGQGKAIPLQPFDSDETRVTITDVLLHAIGKPLDRLTQADRNQVVRYLVHAGWNRRQDRTRGPDRGKWFYVRPVGTSGNQLGTSMGTSMGTSCKSLSK